jgi:hypothetical protein
MKQQRQRRPRPLSSSSNLHHHDQTLTWPGYVAGRRARVENASHWAGLLLWLPLSGTTLKAFS